MIAPICMIHGPSQVHDYLEDFMIDMSFRFGGGPFISKDPSFHHPYGFISVRIWAVGRDYPFVHLL